MSSDLHHDHLHSRGSAPHSSISASRRRRQVLWAIGITGSILVVEAVGGIVSGSLALLSDAGHMFTDLAALLIALAAMVMAEKPAGGRHTYGLARLEVLAALGNAVTFLLVVAMVGWQALGRLSHPALPDWKTMGLIAAIGFLANVFSAWFLHGAEEKDLNIRSAWLHVMGDLASSVGVLGGAAIIAKTGWTWVDPLLSMGIALVIAVSAFRLFWKVLHILLESAPPGLTSEKINAVLTLEIPQIREVHHVHLWEVGSGEIHLTAHLVVVNQMLSKTQGISEKAGHLLKKQLGIHHSTFQLETAVRTRLSRPRS